MKKITPIYLLAAGTALYITLTGYQNGPGTNGLECTGAETGLGNSAGCNKTCHSSSATVSIKVAIELDSSGVPTTHYVGGMNYTVKLTGTNNTTSSLPKFGFQMGSIKGSAAAVTPTNAGTWASPYPANTHYSAPSAGNFVVGIVEHSTPIAATTGAGGNGSTYVETFNWTAPAAGTGTVSIWAALNAVNGNGNEDSGDHWNTTHIVLDELPSGNGVSALTQNSGIIAFPSPATDHTQIMLNGLQAGGYSLIAYDLNGRKIISRNIELNGGDQTETIATDTWTPGVYLICVANDHFSKTVQLIKN